MKKIKCLVPLALCAALLSSCGASKVNFTIPKLNRVNYKSAPTFTSLSSVFKAMHTKQFPPEQNGVATDFQIFNEGTATVRYCLNASAKKIKAYSFLGDYSYPSVNLNNWNLNLTDTITISWDIAKRYIKVTNNRTSYYVGVEEIDGNYYLYRYFTSPQDGKYKVQDGDYWSGSESIDFGNIVLRESLTNSSIRLPHMFRQSIHPNYECIGFDLSGFSNNWFNNYGWGRYESNIFSPASWAEDKELTAQVDAFLVVNPFNELSMKFATDDFDKTASIAVDLKGVNLSDYDSIIELRTGIRPSGKVDFDCFAAFADYFVKQEEIDLDITDLNLTGIISETPIILDVTDFDFCLHGNEEVTKECTPDDFKPGEYSEVSAD
ncbi:MAG: hypothetical protein MJ214_00805 [Bacilli bacterium]|nr:hypothetical protein [Bacilli bacterium]